MLIKIILPFSLLAILVACSPQSSTSPNLPEKLFKPSPLVSDISKIKKGCYVIQQMMLHRKTREDGTYRYYIPKRVKNTEGSLSPEVVKRYALLDTCPPDSDKIARPMIMKEINGKMKAQVFDISKVFETPKEAIEFAKRNYLKDIQIDQVQE